MKKNITNWGKFPLKEANEFLFRDKKEISNILKNNGEYIARGNGRCYGDASLADNIISTLKFDKILSFDPIKGIVECQSGVTLDEIIKIILPKGWFLSVTPGTKYITLGGAIASDVHGKNHHIDGCFCDNLIYMDVMTESGEVLRCSPTENMDLFAATSGGMGLTGVILQAAFKLKRVDSAYISQKQIKAKNLEEIITLFDEYKNYTYSMAWIDCLKKGDNFGRSILMLGEHSRSDELPYIENKFIIPQKKKLFIPFNFPSVILNPYTIKAFNMFFYAKNRKKIIDNIIPYEPFFYPLDSILHWNRMYGKNGFVQYQFVLPLETSYKGLIDILNRINKKGMGSFLAVLKLFGKQNSLISFPMEGFTLALDFPIKKGLFNFLDELDKVVLNYGGRIYLSKDARMKSDFFLKGYKDLDLFISYIKKYNPGTKFQSDQSKRLGLNLNKCLIY